MNPFRCWRLTLYLETTMDEEFLCPSDSPPEERMASFPQARNDEDAIFKERLKNMGKSK